MSESDQQYMRANEVAAYLSIGRSTVWQWAKEGRLPQPIRLAGRATVWRRSDLDAWVEGKTAA